MDFHSLWMLLEASMTEEKQSCLESLNPCVLTEDCWRFRMGNVNVQDPSLTIETLGLDSRPVYSVSWKPLWRVCISEYLQGDRTAHTDSWEGRWSLLVCCLHENSIRSLRDSFFDVLFLMLSQIPYFYQEGNALQSMKNQNYRMAVCSGWACKSFPCFK